jgi:hypothetical protein
MRESENVNLNLFDVILAAMPLIFSIVIMFFGLIKNNIEKVKVYEKDNIKINNEDIKKYNFIMFKSIKKINDLNNLLKMLVSIYERLLQQKDFSKFIKPFMISMKNEIEASNNENLRALMKNQLDLIANLYYENNDYLNDIDYLSNINTCNMHIEILDLDEAIFIFEKTSRLIPAEKIFKILNLYTITFYDSKYLLEINREFNQSINELYKNFKMINSNKNIQKEYFSGLLQTFFIKYFDFLQKINIELIMTNEFIENFQILMTENYSNIEKNIKKRISRMIAMKQNTDEEKLLLDKEAVFKFYNI